MKPDIVAEISTAQEDGVEIFYERVPLPQGSQHAALKYLNHHPELPAGLALKIFSRAWRTGGNLLKVRRQRPENQHIA